MQLAAVGRDVFPITGFAATAGAGVALAGEVVFVVSTVVGLLLWCATLP